MKLTYLFTECWLLNWLKYSISPYVRKRINLWFSQKMVSVRNFPARVARNSPNDIVLIPNQRTSKCHLLREVISTGLSVKLFENTQEKISCFEKILKGLQQKNVFLVLIHFWSRIYTGKWTFYHTYHTGIRHKKLNIKILFQSKLGRGCQRSFLLKTIVFIFWVWAFFDPVYTSEYW